MSTNVNFRRDKIAAHDSLLFWAVIILRSVSCNSVSNTEFSILSLDRSLDIHSSFSNLITIKALTNCLLSVV